MHSGCCLSHMAIHMYGHKHPPGHRCSPKIFRGLIPSLCKVFQFQNKQHSWPNKFNVIKSAKFKVGAQNAYLNVHKFYFYNAALKILQGLSIHILMSIYLHYFTSSCLYLSITYCKVGTRKPSTDYRVQGQHGDEAERGWVGRATADPLPVSSLEGRTSLYIQQLMVYSLMI